MALGGGGPRLGWGCDLMLRKPTQGHTETGTTTTAAHLEMCCRLNCLGGLLHCAFIVASTHTVHGPLQTVPETTPHSFQLRNWTPRPGGLGRKGSLCAPWVYFSCAGRLAAWWLCITAISSCGDIWIWHAASTEGTGSINKEPLPSTPPQGVRGELSLQDQHSQQTVWFFLHFCI